jgi:molecular chaperone HtpG
MTTETPEAYRFKAEIKQLLQILVHSLYKDKDIFLRELISNASDALARMQFEMLTNSDVFDADAELAIRLEVVENDDSKTLIVKDSGIGMTHDELIRNLGTIAQSGAREFLATLSEGKETATDVIGQFGVGFYSVFMVADEVRVVSRSYQKDAEAAVWISDGGEDFRVESAEKTDRGTEIHIKLNADSAEFVQPHRLREVVKKHSDFVSFPIYLDDDQINQQESLWRKRPQDVEADDYNNFYQQMTLDFEPPLTTIHFSSDVPLNVRTMLFVPAKREKTMFALRKEPGLKLYSNNVLIQEYNTDLLPEWLWFVDGIVDSEDLPLNVSRETVHNSRLMRHLGKTIRKRVLRELGKLAKDTPEKYAEFLGQYQFILKQGLAMEPQSKDDIVPLLRFQTSKSNGEWVALETYVERMGEEQEAIYYVLGDSVESVAYSPHLDPFKARDIEVLYFVDPIDPFLATALTDYKEKTLQDIGDADIDLPEVEEADADETPELEEKERNLLIGRFVATLGERVTEVRETKALRDSPLRLVSPEDAPNAGMQRIYRMTEQNYEIPKRIVELNLHHPIMINLGHALAADSSAEIIDLTIDQLFDSALVQEGLHPNPTAMLPRIQKLMELATGNQATGALPAGDEAA